MGRPGSLKILIPVTSAIDELNTLFKFNSKNDAIIDQTNLKLIR